MADSSKPFSQASEAAPGERTFLVSEAGIAKQAMAAAWKDAKANLADALNPKHLTGAHPFVALLGAATAGFAAACVVVPTKEDQALKKLAELQRAVHGLKPGERLDGNGHPAGKSATEAEARKLGITGLLTAEVFKLIRPMLTSVLQSLVAAKMSPEDAAAKVGDDSDRPDDAGSPNAQSSGHAPAF